MMKRYAGRSEIAAAPLVDIEDCVSTLNYCKTKAKAIKMSTDQVEARHKGKVPFEYDDLVKLRGVGPKIAHLMR
jgi:endonuclease III